MFLGELFDHLPTMFLPDRKQVVDVEFSQSIARWSARTTNPASEKTTLAIAQGARPLRRRSYPLAGGITRCRSTTLILALPAIANA